jgi:hypothetical protein
MATARTLFVCAVALLLASCKMESGTTAAGAGTASTIAPVADTAATATTTTGTAPAGTTTGTASTASVIPPVVISGNIPVAVPIPSSVSSPTQARPFFDWFSWESFIALNWPASSTGRGNPDRPTTPSVFLQAKQGTTVAWGTYKANWELFNQGSARPTEWSSYKVAIPPQCTAAKPGEKELLMVSKGDTVLNDGLQAFSFPLVDVARNYVLYEVHYNEAQYNFIRGSDNSPSSWLYLAKNLNGNIPTTLPASQAPPATQPPDKVGSIMVKASWRNLTPVPQSQWSRYYVVTAQAYDAAKKQCVATPMGLVGLHIAQKTKDFPEWIWSSFEQVDNLSTAATSGMLAPCTDPICQQHGFNPATRPKSLDLQPDPAKRIPTQVLRLNPIPTTPAGSSTVDVNAKFQAALKGTVWANYELVITQWPTDPTNFKLLNDRGVYPNTAGGPFPVTGATNVTMETYFQSANDAPGAGGNSCMSCHYDAGLRDFSWGLMRRPHK